MSAKRNLGADDLAVIRAAYHLLLQEGRAVRPERLAAAMGRDAASTEESLASLEGQGEVKRDECGCIQGVYGISVVPTEHEVEFAGQRRWAWCAKTALGTVGALALGGTIRSSCPVSGRTLELSFEGASPGATEGDWVVLWPDERFSGGCSSAAEQLCPNINFFASREIAQAWVDERGVTGDVLGVPEAAERAVDWAEHLEIASLRDSFAEEVAAAAR